MISSWHKLLQNSGTCMPQEYQHGQVEGGKLLDLRAKACGLNGIHVYRHLWSRAKHLQKPPAETPVKSAREIQGKHCSCRQGSAQSRLQCDSTEWSGLCRAMVGTERWVGSRMHCQGLTCSPKHAVPDGEAPGEASIYPSYN